MTKTKISAQVIADSKNEFGNRITTMIVTFPRFILAELNTHRMMSRNSASSRAIPFEKMLKSVDENPFVPIAWQKDHKGMQGTEYFTDPAEIESLKVEWLRARDLAMHQAMVLSEMNLTKQICNRLLEPFMWHTVIITASEFENFFYLRCPKYCDRGDGNGSYRSKKDAIKLGNWNEYEDHTEWSELDWLKHNKGQAEIHMMALAEAMWDAYNESAPKDLKSGEWHIPFGDNIDADKLGDLLDKEDGSYTKKIQTEGKIKIATARCARVSYTVVGEEGKAHNYENDFKLHDNLLVAGHMSPFEHCARAMNDVEYNPKVSLIGGDNPTQMYSNNGMSGNLCGFVQYRKLLPGENKI